MPTSGPCSSDALFLCHCHIEKVVDGISGFPGHDLQRSIPAAGRLAMVAKPGKPREKVSAHSAEAKEGVEQKFAFAEAVKEHGTRQGVLGDCMRLRPAAEVFCSIICCFARHRYY